MIKYCLKCKNCSIEFESWFGSSDEFDRLKKLKHLVCQNYNYVSYYQGLESLKIRKLKKRLNT